MGQEGVSSIWGGCVWGEKGWGFIEVWPISFLIKNCLCEWLKHDRRGIDFIDGSICADWCSEKTRTMLIFHNSFNKVELDRADLVPVFPRNPSECMVGVNCGKQKYCSGLDFSHTAAILLSTSSLQQTRLPLLQLVCGLGWWVLCLYMHLLQLLLSEMEYQNLSFVLVLLYC